MDIQVRIENYIMKKICGEEINDFDILNIIHNMFKDECKKCNISFEKTMEIANTKVQEILNVITNMVNNANKTSYHFDIENLNKQFKDYCEELLNSNDCGLIDLDSLVNMDIMHNPTISICEEIRKYMAEISEKLISDLCNHLYYLEEEYDASEYDDIFGSNEKVYYDEDREKMQNLILNFECYSKIGELLSIRKNYIKQLNQKRNELLYKEEQNKYPDYIEELNQLVKHESGFKLYYHGADSIYTAEKIVNEGLYMQFGEISRTAVPELSIPEIIKYSYGHDCVGRHAMIVICIPDGKYVIKHNTDDVLVAGTSQGLEQGSFHPKYKIDSKYILGYVDKLNKKIVYNPEFNLENAKSLI